MANRTTSSGNGSAATGGSVYYISNIGKPSLVILVVCIGLALGLSIGGLVVMNVSFSFMKSEFQGKVDAAEKRAMDMSRLAEREARIAQDKTGYVQVELAKKGIYITTDGH